MKATAYNLTSNMACEKPTRDGVCAINGYRKHKGDIACVYLDDNGELGEFLGYYEVLDHCPTKGVIDIWMRTGCREFGHKDVLVKFIKVEG